MRLSGFHLALALVCCCCLVSGAIAATFTTPGIIQRPGDPYDKDGTSPPPVNNSPSSPNLPGSSMPPRPTGPSAPTRSSMGPRPTGPSAPTPSSMGPRPTGPSSPYPPRSSMGPRPTGPSAPTRSSMGPRPTGPSSPYPPRSSMGPRPTGGSSPNLMRSSMGPRPTGPSAPTRSSMGPRPTGGSSPNLTRSSMGPRPTGPSAPTRSSMGPRPTGARSPNLTRSTQPPRQTQGRTASPLRTTAGARTTQVPFRQRVDLSSTDSRKLNGAISSGSTSSFVGNSMFSGNGSVSDQYTDSLNSEEKQSLQQLQALGSDVFDLASKFNDALPDDLQFFIQEFKNMDDTVFNKLKDSPNTVQPDDLKKIPLAIIAAMKNTTLDSIASQLPPATRKAACQSLARDMADYDTTKKLVASIPCAAILSAAGEKPSRSLAEAIAETKVEEQDPSAWDRAKWRDAITTGWFAGLTDDVIDKCPTSELQGGMDKVKDLMDNMDAELKKKVFKKLGDSMGGFSRLNASALADMKDVIQDLTFSELKDIDPSAIRQSMSSLKDSVSGMTRLQKMQLKRSVKTGLTPGNMTADEVVNSAALIGKDRSFVRQLDKAVLIRNLTQLGQIDFNRKSARSFARKLREDADYDEASDFDNTKFKKMGKIAAAFSARVIRNMTNVNFDQVLDDGALQDVDFSKDTATAIIERIKNGTSSGTGDFTRARLRKMGKLVVGFRQTDVDDMNADDLANGLDDIKDTIKDVLDDMETGTIDKIIDKVGSASGGLGGNMEKIGSLLKKVPVRTLKTMSAVDFGDMSGQTERNLDCGTDTCPELYQRVVDTIGRPGLRNPNFTLSTFMNLKDVMCGMTLDDLKELPVTKYLEDIVGYLLKRMCLSDKQERVLAEKIKYRMGFYSTRLRTIRRQDVKKYGGIMKHFTKDELTQIGRDRCTDIVLELGTQDLSNVKKDQIKQLTDYALECVDKTQGPLTSDEITKAGDLVCGLSPARIADVDTDAMQDAVYTVQSRCEQLDAGEKRKWAEVAMDKLDVTASTIQDVDDVILTQMGTLVADMDKDVLDNIPSTVMESIGPDLVEQFDERKTKLEARDKKGFGNDVSDDDRTDMDNKQKDINTRLITAFTTVTSGRRRRSTTALTCDDMQLLGSGVTAMTTTQIEAVSDAEFLDCAQTLGSYSTWTSNQILSLLTVAVRSGVYGDPSGWTASNVYDAGIIAQGLTSTQISALPSVTTDAMYSIGRHDGWSETQLLAGFERWLTLVHAGTATSVTSTNLISLGHFACGASTDHITDIGSSSYSYAASYIGELTSCQQTQLVSWANHAKSSFGNVNTWDTAVITTVGTVMGGLTASEISTLTTSQVAAIQPSSIASIPSATFVGFTVDQLLSFSTAQAQSVTQNQQSGLSSAQLTALQTAGATLYNLAATATMVRLSTTLLALSVAVSGLLHQCRL